MSKCQSICVNFCLIELNATTISLVHVYLDWRLIALGPRSRGTLGPRRRRAAKAAMSRLRAHVPHDINEIVEQLSRIDNLYLMRLVCHDERVGVTFSRIGVSI